MIRLYQPYSRFNGSSVSEFFTWYFDERSWMPAPFYDELLQKGWPENFPKFSHLLSAIPYAILISLIRLVFVYLSTLFAKRFMPLPRPSSASGPEIVAAKRRLEGDFATFFAEQQKKDSRAKSEGKKGDVTAEIRRKEEAKKDYQKFLSRLLSREPYDKTTLRICYTNYALEVMNAQKIKKFNEAAWICSVYGFIWVFGLSMLLSKDYFYNTSECWTNYIHQTITSDIHAYYFLSLGHYLHLLVAQFFDTKRKDFVEMFIHHVVTICLLSFSYVIGYVRVGTLVLFVHDLSDVLLQFAKILLYLGFQTACDITFVLFALCFAYMRLYAFPFWVLNCTMYENTPILGILEAPWWTFNSLLWILQVLHIIWFSIIAKMGIKLMRGGINKDERSESEAEGPYGLDDENTNETEEKNHTPQTTTTAAAAAEHSKKKK